MSPNHIERKHRREQEAVVDDALRSSMGHLAKAHSHFGAVIQNPDMQDEFTEGIAKAQEVICKLGVDW